ncbi:DUF6596 domain-containing protein [Cellulomonas cellasea]|uniref:Uncharacterized protein n=2 Tax=Cellulomonas cellasea TaxID=43670 RepID=A0A0A0B129_9CELL|nr:DUF6596 domain-containing protein [Cellulomonas cellasea]KGM00490.1 hypothetical protein Q760_08370 [Cellulomonas cellasea DSM 20118]GEA86602.1 hypothetical protein CCE01nite_05510 [Cellulomonas cellasea]
MTTDVEGLLRRCAPQALGAVARRHADFAAAEDAVQEALLAGAQQWPRDGVPDNPVGWLVRVAVRRLADEHREVTARRRREARVLHAAVPDDAEVTGLLALLLLTEARRPARSGPHGELVPLAEQDRSLWDRRLVVEGVHLATDALRAGRPGEHTLQACIAALHDQAPSSEATDWPQVLALYDRLHALTGSPVVALHRAVALAMVHGPARGLAALDGVAERLGGGHRLHAVRAHLLELDGRPRDAVEAYRHAAAAATNLREREYLTLKAARLT